MQFLLEKGFTQELIDKLTLKYDEGILDVFQIEKRNVSDVIDFFRQIGIENIEELMLFRIELFTKDVEEVKEIFDDEHVHEMVQEINEDILNIDKI